MTSEHEKLLKQLFVTYDITKDTSPKDFGFVKCSVEGTNVKVDFTGAWLPDHFQKPTLCLADFEEKFASFLDRIVDMALKSPPVSLKTPDVVEFQIGKHKIRCAGPIGVHVIDGGGHNAIANLRRFEVVR